MQLSLGIRSKLFLSTLLILLVSYLILLVTTFQSVGKYIEQDIAKGMTTHLNFTWNQYFYRADQIKYSLMQPILAPPVQQHLQSRDAAWFRDAINRWHKVLPFVDTLTVMDAEKTVVARLNSGESGDRFGLTPLVDQAFRDKRVVISTELVPFSYLCREGQPGFCPPLPKDGEAMLVMVVLPVFTPDGTLLGAVVAGDMINNDPTLSVQLKEIFGKDTEVNITQRGLRIASSSAVESFLNLEPQILERLEKGRSYRGETIFGNKSYETVFEPITNSRGDFVGSLSVAISKESLKSVRRDHLKNIFLSVLWRRLCDCGEIDRATPETGPQRQDDRGR
jgi:hypothetical protein